MFAIHTQRPDFTDTRTTDSGWTLQLAGAQEGTDAADLLASADAADLHLLRLVGCAAAATLLLALASSLGA